MRKDLCRHCGNDVERAEGLSAAETEMCAGCRAAYRTLLAVPAYAEHRGSRWIPAEIEERIERYIGGRL